MSKINCTAMDLPPLEELKLETPGEDTPPSPARTIEDLPPEVLTKILEFATLNGDRAIIFKCRRVNSQWKDIMDSIIEKRILSDEFPICPKMVARNGDDGQLEVHLLPTRFPDGRNPFPFNSTHFDGGRVTFGDVSNNEPERSQLLMLSLPAFTSRFGGNLTTFALQGQLFSINGVAAMLGPMTSLKRLSFSNVWDRSAVSMGGKQGPVVIPSAPPLPNLSTLQIEARSHQHIKINIINVWLIASYADQLVWLDLFENNFPALQPSHEYTYSVADVETRPIATTSESAFRNLKELKVSCPSREFLTLSKTPALQRFAVVVGLFGLKHLELEDVITFIDKCSSSLETLVLNNLWALDRAVKAETTRRLVDGHRPLFTRISQVVFPRLKTVMFRYPRSDIRELILSEFLVKFPSMKRLQLVEFAPHEFYQQIPVEEVDHQHFVNNNEADEFGNENNQNAAEIVTLKERLSLLFQTMSGILNNVHLANLNMTELYTDAYLGVEDPDRPAQIQQLRTEIEDLERSLAPRITECATIFNELSALGKNTKMVMVEQLLERGGYWNTCPGLRIISISSAENPIGDVCVLRRPDDA